MGAALGLLAGLFYLWMAGPQNEVEAIVVWRNFLLSGAALGALAGLAAGLYINNRSPDP